MREQLTKRLNELKQELESGQKARLEMEQKLTELQKSIIFISGAVKVLEEELNRADTPAE